jgi:nucleotide-binding universal stress UspA family protein
MTVVVGFIPTDEGRAALARGIEEARLRQAKLVVVHSTKGGPAFGPDEAMTTRIELDRLRHELADAGVDYDVRDLVVGNDPTDDLASVINETSAELLVIGLRRRSAVGKFVMGSNAQRILLEIDCPILAVKAD